MDPRPDDAPVDGCKSGGSRVPPPPPADGRSKRDRSPADAPTDGRPKRGRSTAGRRSKRGPADESKRVVSPAPRRWLGYSGIILVLFETPSGFAVLHYDGVKLFRPNSVEKIWTEFMDSRTALNAVILEEFKIFEDNTGAINSDGVSSELAEMINRSLWPGQKLAVAKKGYKDAIEGNLGIDCLFGDAVLELMWGLKNLIKVLVPDEKLELTNEDREQISLGMNVVLRRHSVEADANLVNSDIIDIASTVYETDRLISARDALLQHYGAMLYTVSDIDCKNWDQLKLATALKLVCYPEGEGLHEELLSETEVKTLKKDAHLYEVKFDKRTCLDMFQKIVWASGIRFQALAAMSSIVNETKNGLKLHHESPMAEEAKNGLKLKEEQQ